MFFLLTLPFRIVFGVVGAILFLPLALLALPFAVLLVPLILLRLLIKTAVLAVDCVRVLPKSTCAKVSPRVNVSTGGSAVVWATPLGSTSRTW